MIKGRIGDFLRDHLKLELSPEKTLITPASEKARFLGYEITTRSKRTAQTVDTGRNGSGRIKLMIPAKMVVNLSGLYKGKRRPKPKEDHRFDDDFTIVATYGSVYSGYVQYYKRASNLGWFGHLHWAMYWSLLRTLAKIPKTTANSMRSKYSAIHHRWDSTRGKFVAKRVLKVVKTDPKTGRVYIALFGEVPLTTDACAPIPDGPLQRHHVSKRNELVARLLANTCEVCGSDDRINVHHMRKLKDLKVPGRRTPPIWKQIMAARRRKTLVVCHHCHVAIHNGTLTNRLKALISEGRLTPTGEWVIPERDEPMAAAAKRTGRRSGGSLKSPTGEPGDAKVSSPVRRGRRKRRPRVSRSTIHDDAELPRRPPSLLSRPEESQGGWSALTRNDEGAAAPLGGPPLALARHIFDLNPDEASEGQRLLIPSHT
ncbi:HNH endonuclease [Singulisphaera acidiphila]|uniref:HNH endonuclease n=1 Tax=Singulisphaera acidiphila TaxID=466153 RepID=UPI0012FAC4C3|nr:group II intron reverse transcriptase/maturase [Singulisphaera acidiphila]